MRGASDIERQIARLVDAIAVRPVNDVAAVGDRPRRLETRLAEPKAQS